jgi:DNA-binding transcriptional ArsR family regulator
MDETLKAQVAEVIKNLFDEKEEAKIREKTEAELQKAATSISELTTALEEKNAEVSEFEEKASESEAKIQELTSELEAAKKELETANEKLGQSEKALEDMKKDRAAETRMSELEDAGVARSDKDSQMAKVREMTDEDFASYKDELVSIREAVVAELQKDREKAEADAKAEEEAAKKAAEEEEAKKMPKKDDMMDEEEDPDMKKKKGKKKEKCAEGEEASEESDEGEETASEEEEKETTTPAEVTPGMQAMASLNMEYHPTEDVMAKYRKFGEAMAKRWKKSEE